MEKIIAEVNKCLNCKIAKCKEFCPVHNNIPLIIKLIKEDKLIDAYRELNKTSILPDICSIVCPHEKQCEGHCIRNKTNQGVKISWIENYLSRSYNEIFQPVKNDFKICAIGSGPASLALALYLSRRGYQVDIYEKENDVGGVLYWGIPDYRLDKESLLNYKNELIRYRTNIYLNKEIKGLEDLNDKYDAIFIGNGATIPNKMNIEGENITGVYNAYDFLKDTNLNVNHKDYGQNIVVVGGGNVAIDAARNARRLNANVTIVYRRSENEMPANKEEIDVAKREGVKFLCLKNPVAILGKDKVEKVECAIMELGELDSSNRPRPIVSNQPHVYIEADSVIMAIGFTGYNILNKTNDYIKVDNEYRTNNSKIYSGGDIVTGSKTVVLAMKAGLEAAKNIDKFLTTSHN